MNNKIGTALAGVLLLGSVPLAAQTSPKSLSLEDCILSALKNNLGIQSAYLSPQLAETQVTWAKEKFSPRLSFGHSRQSNSSASYSFIEAAEKVTSSYNDFSASVWQAVPTGGAFSVSLGSYKSESNRSFQTINPRYGSTLSFGFSQPLLKNFGSKMSRREIIISLNNKDISESQLRAALLDMVFTVEQAYWNLIYAIENLKVMQQSLELARDLLSKNRREVEVGMVAPIEILSAEAEVATREADILQAEIAVTNSEDLLKTVINFEAGQEGGPTHISPSDDPIQEAVEVSLDEALRIALSNRPDLQTTRIGLKNKEINVAYAKNQTLPELNLTTSYWSPGISGTQLLYQDDNPLTGVVVGQVPGGAGAALSDAIGLRYSNWLIGLQVSFPVSNFTSRAQYEVSKISYEQALIDLANLEQRIFLEIRTAVRAVEINYKRVLGYRAARELAQKKLEAEEKKLKVGLTTNYVVLQYQRDLANARTAELKSLIEYNLTLAYLDKSLGTSLKNKNIKLANLRADEERHEDGTLGPALELKAPDELILELRIGS
ncbi:MAG: TolC family protein [Candidatus Aminicenantales bacterium]